MIIPAAPHLVRQRRRVLLAALCSLAWAANAQTWKFVDDQGVVHLGNQPSPADVQPPAWRNHGAISPAVNLPALPQQLPGYLRVREPLRAAATASGLDPALVTAVAATESAFNPRAVSAKGAIGLMQLMPETAVRYGIVESSSRAVIERLFDPYINAMTGSRVLADLIRRFDGRLELALAAYNAGEGAILRHRWSIPPFAETEQYVLKVLELYVRWRAKV